MANHENRGRQPRPRQHMTAAGKLYPTAWQEFDQFRAERGQGEIPAWPDWCYCPMAAAYAIVSADAGVQQLPPDLVSDVGRLAALAAWRPTQGIWRFDPALYAALIETPVSGDLPADVLYRLPEWCVYLETPDLEWGGRLYGAFVHLEWDANGGGTELRLVLDSEHGLNPVPIHVGQWTLDEAVERALDVSRTWAATAGASVPSGSREAIRAVIEPVVSLTLYLCAANADRPEVPEPRPKRTKKGWRLFPADKARVWTVGERIGAALRRGYQQQETGQADIDPETGRQRPRPHVRRAHWHTFRAGPGRQERRLRWLPPIPVGVDDPDDLPVTKRDVRDDN